VGVCRHDVRLQADEFLLQVEVGQAVAVVQHRVGRVELDREAVRAFAEQFSWPACAEEFRRNLQPYPEPEKSRFWRRLRRLARLRRGPRRTETQPPAAPPPPA